MTILYFILYILYFIICDEIDFTNVIKITISLEDFNIAS